jgi:pSer/pThr/pTyr-binding forkhead associated (FHA) protein
VSAEASGPDYLELPDGSRLSLYKDVITLGRDGENDYTLSDSSISRRHARLQRLPHGWLLIDLGSTNGTWVNSERVVAPLLLQDDDLVLLGEQRLIFRLASCATRSAPGGRRPRAETELDR